jgi:phosphohistidine phosphatase
MKLYLLRHAIAEDGVGMTDSQRQLTEEGRQKLRKVMRQARVAGLQPDVILSSPYVRARQTATIAVEELRYRAGVVESETLTPGANPHATWQELRAYRDAKQVLVVGHNPHMSSLSCLLVGAPGGAIEMKKAALACFDVMNASHQPSATLEWLMTPKTVGA